MPGLTKYFLSAIAVGGGLVSLSAGVYSIATGRTSLEGIVAIVLLLVLSTSLAAALGIQGLKYRRLARYAVALPDVLRLTEYMRDTTPDTMTGAQATATCDRVVEGLAKVFSLISGTRCFASIEVLTPTRESLASGLRHASDYLVVNLSRDSSAGQPDHEDRRRHSIDGNSAYREIFHDDSCGASYFRADVAADPTFTSTEAAWEAAQLGSRMFGRGPWPLHYRSSLVVKICHADRCRAEDDHAPIAFLWLRSPEPNAFDERHDIELAQRMSRALAPLVTRCVLATKPTHDFRRQSTAARQGIGPTPA